MSYMLLMLFGSALTMLIAPHPAETTTSRSQLDFWKIASQVCKRSGIHAVPVPMTTTRGLVKVGLVPSCTSRLFLLVVACSWACRSHKTLAQLHRQSLSLKWTAAAVGLCSPLHTVC